MRKIGKQDAVSGDAVTGIVEIPQGSRNKTEHDPELRRSSSTGLDNRAYVVDTPAPTEIRSMS